MSSQQVCMWCGKSRARTIVHGGWAHKRCIPGNPDSGVSLGRDPKRPVPEMTPPPPTKRPSKKLKNRKR